MSNVETIFATIVIFIVSGILIVAGFLEYIKESEFELSNEKIDIREDYVDTLFSSLLLFTEPKSGMQFNMLLGARFFNRGDNITTPGGEINTSQLMERMLDHFLGEGKYYFEVLPEITDIRINFVIDGSRSMAGVRDSLKTTLPDFVERLETDLGYEVQKKVYIVNDDTLPCDPFINPPDPADRIECENLDKDKLYRSHDDITDPYYGQDLAVGEAYIYRSDWASATAIVSEKNKDFTPARIDIIVPISSEVNLGTKLSSCYIGATSTYTYYCLACLPKTDTDYGISDSTVDRIIPILTANKQVVCPVISYRGDHTIKSSDIGVIQDHYDSQGWGTFSCGDSHCSGSIPCSSCSSFPVCSAEGNCPGCGEAPPDGCTPSGGTCTNVFWHPEGYDNLQDQFGRLSSNTDGETYELDDGGMTGIYTKIEDLIDDTVDRLHLRIGKRQDDVPTLLFSRTITNPMANDAYLRIRLRYYEEAVFSEEGSYYYLDEDECDAHDTAGTCAELDIDPAEGFPGKAAGCCSDFGLCCI
jgi:hypothetical protein